ncbi:MAG: N-acetylmuramoyl-L-alanine amidase [Eubacterium sp.]|nr:N-acetylmuramoyl-L-alanine amidase [Eubacterium sp.]
MTKSIKITFKNLIGALIGLLIIISFFNLRINAADEGWVKSDGGWWYSFADGSYAKSEYIDGYWMNSSGWYTSGYYGTWNKNDKGWWYQDGAWYPQNQWLKIDKKWYHFSSSGYMDTSKWIGKSYVGQDGVWIEDYTNEDGSVGDPSKKSGNASGKVIVIDPGHSSKVASGTEPLGPGSSETKAKDSGGTKGVATGIYEYQLNMTMAEKLKTELESRGYTVYMTRTDNYTAISCMERAQVANDKNADAYIRIHADGSDNSSASGAMTICITPDNAFVKEMYSESKRLSECLLNSYCSATGYKNRGVWETDTMSGNNWSKVPTTLIELGFMTNPTEDSQMNDASFQEKMVSGMADGIDKFFE